jgi:capsular exopolysaccharide synthesis family protein
MQTQGGLKLLMVTSALPSEGKTLTCVNLALTLSDSFRRRVLLIDGDLRKPSLHQAFGISNTTGLSKELLSTDRPLPLVQVAECLTILPASGPDPNPSAILTSDRMRHLMAEATERFDWVILDSPPVGLISDANLLAALVDGIVLVIGSGSTPYQAAERAITELGRERVVGTVLNRVDTRTLDSAGYSAYPYTEREDDSASRLA